MKHKKLYIFLSVVFGIFLLITILLFTLFKTSYVELAFKNQTTKFASQEQKNSVIQTANINYSSTIFSINKAKIINNIEKENPYIKIVNIETVFPNKLVIHCLEREELFFVKVSDNLFYLCDNEFTILNQYSALDLPENCQTNSIMLTNCELEDTLVVGNKLNLTNKCTFAFAIGTAFAYNNKTVADIKGMFKSIDISFENIVYKQEHNLNEQTIYNAPCLTFTTFDNFKIKLNNANNYMVNKINFMLASIPNLYKHYEDNITLNIDIDPRTNTVISEAN